MAPCPSQFGFPLAQAILQYCAVRGLRTNAGLTKGPRRKQARLRHIEPSLDKRSPAHRSSDSHRLKAMIQHCAIRELCTGVDHNIEQEKIAAS
ncbi:hypothetical protein NDU88_000905 [Pleurodeles waltl]|uniref:Uncharacterized protein n=1 Tax=Pleurodeles waltl TaxID=8319 RepID=A0AAV7MIX3_PLEWA|nr:hypothetical protein NDU88_000905 [Pleurodeles waltl]